MIALVVSHADRASEHIGAQLLELADWTERTDDAREAAAGGGVYHTYGGFELRSFDELHLHLDDVAAAFDDPTMLCFLSRHSGETGPLLSAHFTGNFGPAEYGGSAHSLARACPNAQKRVVEALTEAAPADYDVGIECTHHGPSAVGAPSMFVELGSGPDEWDDEAGARAVAEAILALDGVSPDRPDGRGCRHVVGFGGGHYAPRFERIVRDTDWCVGHIGADWQLAAMGPVGEQEAVVDAAFAESAADLAVVEGDRPRLVSAIEAAGHRVVGETFLQVTTGVPRSLVSALEDAVCPVDEGLRFGEYARANGEMESETAEEETAEEEAAETRFAVVDVPHELLDEALGTDGDTARNAVVATTVGYETAENGTRPAGRVAVPRGEEEDQPEGDDLDAYDRLVDGLCDALRGKYHTVEREEGRVVAQERAFDPDAAADLGVEPGPAFGRLSAGESVEAENGRPVTPEEVHRERTVRFDL